MATLGSLGSLSVDIRANMQGFNNSLSSAQSRLEQTGKKFTEIGGKLTKFVTLPIAGLGVAVSKFGMDLEASEAKYNTVFSGMTDVADAFIEKFKELTPATTAEARGMSAAMQDLLVPLGFVREEATKMTAGFFHVAGALTNFNNNSHTAEDVTSALSAAITGEYDSLKALGIQLDVNTVKEKAVAMGLAETTKEVTKQDQAQVLLKEVYRQSTDALAAYTEENLDAKTKLGILMKSLQDTGATFGKILLPLINKAIKIAQAFNDKLAGMSEKSKRLILVLGAVVASIGPMLIAVGAMITIWAKFGGLLMLLVNGPLLAITVAIGSLAYAGWKLYSDWEDVRDGFKITLLNLESLFVSAFNSITKIVFDVIGKILEKVQSVGSIIGKLFPSIGKNIDELKKTFDKAQKEMTTEQVRKELELQNEKQKIVTEAVERGRQENIKAAEAENLKAEAMGNVDGILEDLLKNLNSTETATDNLTDSVEDLGESYEDLRGQVTDAMTDLGEGVVDALKNMYDDQLRMEEESAERSIKIIELRTQREIGEYEKVYRAKLKTLDEETRASIEAVEEQINTIKEQTEKEEKELDKQEYINRLSEKKKQLNAEESAEKREKITKEISEMIAKRERELLLEQRAEQINALNEEIKSIKTTAKEKEEVLKGELDAEKRSLQLRADEQKNFYEMQLMNAKEYHAEKIKEESLEGEARIALMQANQEDIVKLIESYNPQWKNAGKSLGEKFLEGLSSTEASIRNKINSITGSINTTMAKAKTLNTPASNSLMDGFRVLPRADSGIVVNVTGNTISGQREADKMASSIVSRLRVAGVNP